jgi:hypothetical protein
MPGGAQETGQCQRLSQVAPTLALHHEDDVQDTLQKGSAGAPSADARDVPMAGGSTFTPLPGPSTFEHLDLDRTRGGRRPLGIK